MHDGGRVISVYWFGARHMLGGEQWDFDNLERRTVVRGRSRADNGDGVPILVDAVSMDKRQRRRDSEDEL